MANLYVTSGETFSGKSALCLGLGARLRADGLRVGYMKPVNVNCPLLEGVAADEDVAFARRAFEMDEPESLLLPVALTPARLSHLLRGPEIDYEPRLLEAYAQVAAGRDLLILEGGRSWREGHVAHLPARRVVSLLEARVLLVLKHNQNVLADRALAAQEYFGSSLLGVVINETPADRIAPIREVLVPYLQRHGLLVLGILPRDPLLAAPTVAELAAGLHAEILCRADHTGDLVEHMMVGAMGLDAALTHFRRLADKAVITGGDRADIQLAALETSTRCLILTGNMYPSPRVLSRADERGVPVLLTDVDTLQAVESVESFLGRSRFQEPQKVERFRTILDANLNMPALYESLDLPAR